MDNRRQSGLWNRNPQTGFYEQVAPPTQAAPSGPYQYYQPPSRRTTQERKGRSFSERAADVSPDNDDGDGMQRSDSKRQHEALHASVQAAAAPIQQFMTSYPESMSAHLAQTQHINSTDLPGSSQQQPFSIDPDFVPANLRSQAWSPDPTSQRSQQSQPPPQVLQPKPRQASNASNTSAIIRRDSVPHRSPLQNLESWSKEEKRARVEEAENRARARSVAGSGQGSLSRHGTVGSGKGRVVSAGSEHKSRPTQSEQDQAQQGIIDTPMSPLSGNERFQKATEALKRETTPRDEQSPLQGEGKPTANVRASRHRRTPAIANKPQPYQHAPSSPRYANTGSPRSTDRSTRPNSYHDGVGTPGDMLTAARSPQPMPEPQRLSMDLSRPQGDEYRHRARNTGFTGALAAASAGAGFAAADSAAQRGKAAYERRKSQIQADQNSEGNVGGPGVSEDRSGSTAYGSFPQDQPGIPKSNPVRFAVPPQTASNKQSTGRVPVGADGSHEGQNRFRDMIHHNRHSGRSYQVSGNYLEEWRRAEIARLTIKDLELGQPVVARHEVAPAEDKNVAWWERPQRKGKTPDRKREQVPDLAQPDGPYEEQANGFQPRLFLKCGPLLRFIGIQRETNVQPNSRGAKEIWRGTIMIVTEDNQSDLSSSPVLRLFAQPMDLAPKTPLDHSFDAQNSPAEREDPVAGQVKLSRTGRALYVRPVHEIEGNVDLSRKENPEGLFAAIRSPALMARTTSQPDAQTGPQVGFKDQSRIKNYDGERAKRFREVKAIRLHTERGWTFWRFHIEVELGDKQHRIAYRINRGPAVAFWVPPKGETMNIMFHSCNGFSRSVNPNQFSGPDPLWRDVLNRHQSRPFHVMIGGGDQIYNDIVAEDAQLFKEWLSTKNFEHKYKAEFTSAMQDELEVYYLERYAMWFSQGLFAMAGSQIPMVNIWDDHDIIDGFGSYPDRFMRTLVFSGLGAVAYKYYLLFQHQSLVTETAKSEPSWLLGESPGPYIHEVSRSVFLHLGQKVAFLGLDCRTERMWDEVLSQRTYDLVFERCRKEIIKGQTNHLIVLLGVPIAYPRLNFLENVLTSRAMEPIKAIGRTGMLGGFINKFDGGVEILDDLNDHWTAKHHKAERNWFVQELQELAAEKSVRITILGGDVHLGAVGQFFTPRKMYISKDQDHRYMPNMISSAIVNTPPPNMMADVLNRRNKVHHLDGETDEDMIPMFPHDVDGSKRNNTHLLPRRNYCTIREYHPGTTPPVTPPLEAATPARETFTNDDDVGLNDRRFPPGSMSRTMSLTRGTANLVRRLSGSSRSMKRPTVLPHEHAKPYGSLGQGNQGIVQRANSVSGPRPDYPRPARPINTFHRRPTDLSVSEARKASSKGGALDGREPGHINLEGGLDISLNVEVNQQDPAGTTVPYRLLVPALWYDGPSDPNPARFKSHRASLMDRLRGFRRREMPADGADDVSDYSGQGSRTSSPPPAERPVHQAPPEETMGLTSTGRGAPKPARRVEPQSSDDDSDGESLQDPRTAYNRGYNLASPPIGSTQRPIRSASVHQPSQAKAGASRPSSDFQQPGHQRRVSAPVASIRMSSARMHADDMSDDNSDNDMHEQVDDDPSTPANYPPGVKRGSKAERFLGIGDEDATTTGLWGSQDGVRRTSLQLQRDATGRSTQLGRTGSLRQKLGFKGWKS